MKNLIIIGAAVVILALFFYLYSKSSTQTPEELQAAKKVADEEKLKDDLEKKAALDADYQAGKGVVQGELNAERLNKQVNSAQIGLGIVTGGLSNINAKEVRSKLRKIFS